MNRTKVKAETLEQVYSIVRGTTRDQINEKGSGAFVSTHETFGVLSEEMDELLDAMRSNDTAGFVNELVDVAIAAIFGVASIMQEDEDVDNRVFKVLYDKRDLAQIDDPILSIPWVMVDHCRRRALLNHDQTLELLNNRGGLSPQELYCLLQDKPLVYSTEVIRDKLEIAVSWLRDRVKEFNQG